MTERINEQAAITDELCCVMIGTRVKAEWFTLSKFL